MGEEFGKLCGEIDSKTESLRMSSFRLLTQRKSKGGQMVHQEKMGLGGDGVQQEELGQQAGGLKT